MLSSSNSSRFKPVETGSTIPADERSGDIRRAMASDDEKSACLFWLIIGACTAATVGISVPDNIQAASEDAAAETPISEFTADYDAGTVHARRDLYADWKAKRDSEGSKPGSQRRFLSMLKAEGWTAGDADDHEWGFSKDGRRDRLMRAPE